MEIGKLILFNTNDFWNNFSKYVPSLDIYKTKKSNFFKRLEWDKDEKENYFLEIDIPGYTKDEIKIKQEGDYLLINCNNEKRGELKYEFTVPLHIEIDKINAEYINGVLKITIIPSFTNDKIIDITIE